ncbi:MAG TPA: hypothetical protein VGD65_06310 [Chryseosolibacter sp.]
MSFYYYLFSCAYWVSIEDLKEKSAPHEYAFMFVSVVDLLLLVFLSGVVSLYLDKNILSGLTVIISSIGIACVNYFLFLNGKRFKKIIKPFERLSHSNYKRKRVATMVMTFVLTGIMAVLVSYMNSLDLVALVGVGI